MKASLRPAAQANPSESASSGPTITQRPVCNPLRGHEQPPSCAQRPLRTRPLTARPGLFDLHTGQNAEGEWMDPTSSPNEWMEVTPPCTYHRQETAWALPVKCEPSAIVTSTVIDTSP